MQEATIAHAYRAEDEWNLAIVLANNGQDFALQGELEKGLAMGKEGLALFRRIGDPWGIGLALCRLGVIYRLMKEPKEAKTYLLEAEKISSDAGSGSHMNNIKREMALIALGEGDIVQAAILTDEALNLARKSKIADKIADALDVVVQVTGSAGEYEHSLSLAAFLTHYFESKGELCPPWQRSQQEANIALARQNLSQERANRAWQMGVDMTLEQAAHYAEEVARAITHKDKTQ